MNAIMVSNNDGTYEMMGAAEAEDWRVVRAEADAVEKIDDLIGWGEYTAAYRVQVDGTDLTYFVAENVNTNDAARIQIAKDFVAAHKNDDIDEWLPRNVGGEAKYLHIYNNLVGDVYGQVSCDDVECQIEIRGMDTASGNPYIFTFADFGD